MVVMSLIDRQLSLWALWQSFLEFGAKKWKSEVDLKEE